MLKKKKVLFGIFDIFKKYCVLLLNLNLSFLLSVKLITQTVLMR